MQNKPRKDKERDLVKGGEIDFLLVADQSFVEDGTS